MKRKLLYAIIAALLAIATAWTVLTGCFGLYGPGAKLLKAGKGTLAQKNFTVLVTKTRDGETTSTMTYQVCIDYENRDLTVVGTNQKNNIRFAIYKGMALYRSLFGDYSRDIRPTIDAFFDAYETAAEPDIEQLLKALDEDVYNELSAKADMDAFVKSASKVYFNANSPLWLMKNAGYSQKRQNGITEYRFSPDWDTLSTAIMEEFEDAFYEPTDYDAALKQVQDELEDRTAPELSFSIGVQDGKVVSFTYTTQAKTVTAELTRFGTTQIETAPLEELLSTAQSN